mgnify:FL=1
MRTKSVNVELYVDNTLIESINYPTIKRAIERAGFLCEKHGFDDKGYTRHQIERQFIKSNCPRVSYEDSGRRVYLTLTKAGEHRLLIKGVRV